MSDRRRLRAGGSGGSAPSTPNPDWDLRGEDALFTANVMTSWPAVVGPSLTPVPTLEPRDTGTVANGHVGVLFPTAGARAYSDATIKVGSYATCSWIITFNADNAAASGDRQYLIYIYNLVSGSAFHWVAAEQINVVPFVNVGLYAGSGGVANWIDSGAAATSGRQTIAYVLDAAGLLRVYRNGTLIGSATNLVPAATTWTGPVVGASYEIPATSASIGQWFKGTFHRVRLWIGVELTAGQVTTLSAEDTARYDVHTPTWLPSSVVSCTHWYDQAFKQNSGSGVFTGAALALWGDRSAYDNPLIGGGGTEPADAVDASRINGYAAVTFDGTNDYMSPGTVADLFSAAAYEYYIVGNIASISSSTTTPYSQQCLIADASGFQWAGLRNNAGAYTAYCGHWDGAAKSAIVTVPVGTDFVLHVWYDGTNINAQVDDGAVVQTAAGNITSLVAAMRWGRSSNNLYTNMTIVEQFGFNAELSVSDRDEANSFITTKYGLPVG